MAAPMIEGRERGDAFWFERATDEVPARVVLAEPEPPRGPEPAWEPEPPRQPEPAWEPEPPRQPEPAWEPEPVAAPVSIVELDLPDPPEFRITRRTPPPLLEPAPEGEEPLAPQPETLGWTDPWGFEIPENRARRRRRQQRRRQREHDHGVAVPSERAGTRGTRRETAGRLARLGRGPLVMLALGACVTGVALGVHRHGGQSYTVHRAADRHSKPMAVAPAPSAYARHAIPASYLPLYVRAAHMYGLPWTMLAAVGQIESHSGTSELPGVTAGTNTAGAAGPAQFLAATWERYGVDVDGRGQSSPYDPADAISAMAAYLKASGAPQDWRQALFSYNHSQAYVDSVLALSAQLTAGGGSGSA
ncbi:MAG TPA: lytic murein transglycosylase [Solirubrobacteraceae bacterium]|nr:lytic murein transglycosylase [Solirubrobacteraceae bacterium]